MEKSRHLIFPLPNHLDGHKTPSQDLNVKVSLWAKVSIVGSVGGEVLSNNVLLLGLQVGKAAVGVCQADQGGKVKV